MPRRLTRAQSHARTREQLLAAAEDIFSQRGFNGASVEEVAEAAGYSKGAVYSNFASKAELVLALIDRQIEASRPGWAEAFAPEKALPARIDAVARLLAQQDCAWTMLEMEFFLYALRTPAARAKLARRYRTIRTAMVEHLQRHFADSESAPPIPLPQLAWVLAAIDLGLHLQVCLDPEAVPDGLWAASQFPLQGKPLT